jgi:hypothetical protein
MTENNQQINFLIDNFNDPPRGLVAPPPLTLRRTAGQEGDPSSRKALLWMTANYDLDDWTIRLEEADRFGAMLTNGWRSEDRRYERRTGGRASR